MRTSICAVLSILLGGCVSHNAYLSGTIDARLVDRVSHAPVAGAKATLRSPEDPAAVAEAIADSAGSIRMGPLRGRMVVFVGDRIVKPALLRIEATGYEPFLLELKGASGVQRFANRPARPPDDILVDPKR